MTLLGCEDETINHPNDCLSGSGSTVTESRTVGAFNSIEAAIAGNLYITQGAPQELTITTHPNVMQELKTTVSGEVLEIETDRCMSNIETLDIHITIPDIESIVFSGIGNIESENDWDLDNLSIIFSGIGETHLSGDINNFSYTLSGNAGLSAFDLTATNSTITISGNGMVEITALDNLNIVISGIGHVFYKGTPDISSTISGNGDVVNAN